MNPLAGTLVRFRRRSPLRHRDRDRITYLKICLLCYGIWIVPFELVGWYAAGLHTSDLSLAIDRRIPLIPEFVWPYHLGYVVPFLLVVATNDLQRINRAIIGFFLASLTAFVVYLVLPVSVPRPSLGASVSERFLAFAYSVDFQPSANKFPSLHVTMPWIVFLACRGQRLSPTGDGVLFLLVCAISVSTLFVKQHVVLDVIAGAALGIFAWWFAGRFCDRLTDRALPAPMALAAAVKKLRPGIALYAAAVLVIVALIELKAL